MWFAEPEKFRADQLAALVTEATGGELHLAVAPSPVWLDDDEAAAANAELTEVKARYPSSADALDEPDFRELAELLTTPAEARFGWVADTRTGIRLGILTAASPWFGLIAVRENDDIYVRTFRDEHLSGVLADVLPDWPRPAEQPVSVLRSDVLAAANEVVGTVAPSADVRRATRLAAENAHVISELYVETRDTAGIRHVGKQPLRVYDTDRGRWSMTVTPLPGDERVQLTPASRADVARILDEHRRELLMP